MHWSWQSTWRSNHRYDLQQRSLIPAAETRCDRKSTYCYSHIVTLTLQRCSLNEGTSEHEQGLAGELRVML